MIIFSDVHLKEESEETVFGQVLPGLFNAAKERGEKEMVCLGDLFHFRYKVDARIQNLLKDEFRRWVDAELDIRILVGNHDQYDLEGRNVLELFHEMNHVRVYSEAGWDGDGMWIPYRKDPAYIEWAIKRFHGNSMNLEGKRVCFMHNGLTGALMNDHFKNDIEGVAVDAFHGFDTVLCGHYHKRQTIFNETSGSNVVASYVGSPYQTRADESGQEKGYAVWDGKRLEYVNTRWGKRYHRIALSDGDALELEGIDAGDDVRVSTAVGVDSTDVAAQLIEAGIRTHTVTPDVEPLQVRLDVPENADLDAYARAYVEAQETHLDKTKLINFFDTLRRQLAGAA